MTTISRSSLRAASRKGSPLRHEDGRTLIEVMIALTLGLMITGVLLSVYLSNKQSYSTNTDFARMQQDARLAMHQLTFHIRMGGYAPPNAAKANAFRNRQMTTLSDYAVRGCNGGYPEDQTATPSCSNTLTGSDAIDVTYVVDPLNSAGDVGATVGTDCTGAASTEADGIITNRFYVAVNPDTQQPELFCKGSSNAPAFPNAAQPLAENVESMDITYGVDTNDDKSIDQYDVPASEALNWDQVVAVRVCLIVRTANANIALKPQTFLNCRGEMEVAPDRRLRTAVTSTLMLRNRDYGTLLQ